MARLGRVIVFAKDMERMCAFYRDVLALGESPTEHASADWRVFGPPGADVALHAIPTEFADGIEIAEPPAPRLGTPVKLVLLVDDLASERERLAAAGVAGPVQEGVIDGELLFLDYLDPEGNVVQLATGA